MSPSLTKIDYIDKYNTKNGFCPRCQEHGTFITIHEVDDNSSNYGIRKFCCRSGCHIAYNKAGSKNKISSKLSPKFLIPMNSDEKREIKIDEKLRPAGIIPDYDRDAYSKSLGGILGKHTSRHTFVLPVYNTWNSVVAGNKFKIIRYANNMTEIFEINTKRKKANATLLANNYFTDTLIVVPRLALATAIRYAFAYHRPKEPVPNVMVPMPGKIFDIRVLQSPKHIFAFSADEQIRAHWMEILPEYAILLDENLVMSPDTLVPSILGKINRLKAEQSGEVQKINYFNS